MVSPEMCEGWHMEMKLIVVSGKVSLVKKQEGQALWLMCSLFIVWKTFQPLCWWIRDHD